MGISLSDIKNKTSESLDLDDLRQLPISIRDYFSRTKTKFDALYNNRSTDTYLQRFRSTKYPVQDRLYGSPNEEICNIYLNILNSKEVNDLIDDYIFNNKWVYHPVRKFDRWTTISRYYYSEDRYFWLLLMFNRIADPFQSLLNFNMIRVANQEIIQSIPYRDVFNFRGVTF
jgi:hypothetical protein